MRFEAQQRRADFAQNNFAIRGLLRHQPRRGKRLEFGFELMQRADFVVNHRPRIIFHLVVVLMESVRRGRARIESVVTLIEVLIHQRIPGLCVRRHAGHEN